MTKKARKPSDKLLRGVVDVPDALTIGFDRGYRAGLLDAIKDVDAQRRQDGITAQADWAFQRAAEALHARLAALDGGKP